ncbi:hypothetical protein BDR07DRAFT_1373634 [Suillus spraguei]|nr:hypothetical protein BDR07DRAFT_1373634 [Suillus spraguei]
MPSAFPKIFFRITESNRTTDTSSLYSITSFRGDRQDVMMLRCGYIQLLPHRVSFGRWTLGEGIDQIHGDTTQSYIAVSPRKSSQVTTYRLNYYLTHSMPAEKLAFSTTLLKGLLQIRMPVEAQTGTTVCLAQQATHEMHVHSVYYTRCAELLYHATRGLLDETVRIFVAAYSNTRIAIFNTGIPAVDTA